MDTLNTGLQPFWNLINIIRGVFILLSIGLGVCSAFLWEDLMKSLVVAGFFFLILSSLSSFAPGLTLQFYPYFWGWGIGFAIGIIVKWIIQKMVVK